VGGPAGFDVVPELAEADVVAAALVVLVELLSSLPPLAMTSATTATTMMPARMPRRAPVDMNYLLVERQSGR
jgi:hypothetical protein